MSDEADTRTYYVDDEGGTTTVDRIFGHAGFPCPPTRGQVDTCAEAWDRWQKTAPVHLARAPHRVRPRIGPLERPPAA